MKNETTAAVRPRVSVVIVSWNGKHLLDECLDSLFAQRYRDFEVIVVDNGSQDGTVAFLREHYPDVVLVSLTENRGYAGGNNAGLHVASGSLVVLLNNDTTVDPAWLESLVRTAEREPKSGMWASRILTYDDPELIDNVGHLIYQDGLARGKGRLEKDRGQYEVPEEALWPSGCAGMYRKEMLDEIGLLDEEFFAYADDVDLGLRGRLAGWKCTYVPAAKVYHKYSASSSAYSPLKAFLVERNRIWVLLKYYPLELIILSPFYTLKRFLIQFYGALSNKGAAGKFTKQYSVFTAVGILLKAWFFALAGLPRVIRQRRAFSRKKRIGRAELYRLFKRFRISAREIALKD